MTSRPTIALVVAGLSFLLYPVLRGFGPETGPAGAEHFAATTWTVAHVLAMIGFVALALAARWRDPDEAWWRRTELLAWISAALLLPYYGAESFALNALGRWVVAGGDVAALAVADGFRYAVLPLVVFGLGLLGLAVLGVRLALRLWPRGLVVRLGAVLTAVGLVTFLPQFFGPGGLRIAHGAVLCVGLLLLAVGLHATIAPVNRGPAVETDR